MGNVPDSSHAEIENWFPEWKANGMTIADFPRYRAVTVYPDQPLVVIRTRTGGGNREEYEEENEKLRALQGFIKDEDDDFDCTYAYWHYEIPEESRAAWKTYCAKNAEDPPDHEQRVVIPTDWSGKTQYGKDD